MSAEPVSEAFAKLSEDWWADIDKIIEEAEYVSKRSRPKAFIEIELEYVARITTAVEELVEDQLNIPELPVFTSAVCATVDPEIFFPEKGKATDIRKARKLCLRCIHTSECREFAIKNRIKYGIWGGMTYNDRRKMMKMVGIEEDGEER